MRSGYQNCVGPMGARRAHSCSGLSPFGDKRPGENSHLGFSKPERLNAGRDQFATFIDLRGKDLGL